MTTKGKIQGNDPDGHSGNINAKDINFILHHDYQEEGADVSI